MDFSGRKLIIKVDCFFEYDILPKEVFMSNTEFTPKQRLISAITGKETDRMPWSPFLAYYWEHLPQSVQEQGQLAYLTELGADPLLRGFYSLSESVYHNCTVTPSKRGNRMFTTYETPVGTLQEGYTYSESAQSWFLTDHPVQTEEDFKTLQYIFEHMELKENFEPFQTAWKETGESGLILPVIGASDKTPFQKLVEHWCGTVDLTYALYDFPEVVEECLSAMETKSVQSAEIAVKTDAEGFIFWEDSSTTNISPDFFRKYTAPSITRWGEILHQNNKFLIHHACGHIRDLLPLMNQTPVDMIESISPPPTGNIDMDAAFALLDSDKGLIGGIEPTFFENCTIRELEERVDFLCRTAAGRRFILANSDSCPPGVSYEKFAAVSRMIKHGTR